MLREHEESRTIDGNALGLPSVVHDGASIADVVGVWAF
jgi:hypothetical protein